MYRWDSMASAGWDEVLGGGASGGDGDAPGHDGGDGGGDDDGTPEKKKRVKTSTKIVLVVAGWLLLTLFLVGQFSADKAQPSAVARLDAVSGEDGATDETLDEEFEPEPVDTEEEEALDTDGDGFLSAAEQGIVEGDAAASLESGGSSSSSGSGGSGSTSGGTSTGGDSGSGGNAVPGTAPGGGPTTSTTRAGSGTTTTTTAGGGGGGGGTTSSTPTTKPGGGNTTTTTPSTTSTTTGGPPPPPPVTITIRATAKDTYTYPSGYTSALQLPAGSKITFDNDHAGTRHSFTVTQGNTVVWDTGRIRSIDPTETSPEFAAGTYAFTCTNEDQTMGGSISVT